MRDTAEFANVLILVLQTGAIEEDVARVAHEKVGVRGHACKWMLRARLPEIRENLFYSRLLLCGRGFTINTGLGIAPAMLSLGMVLTYSVVLGVVYAAVE